MAKRKTIRVNPLDTLVPDPMTRQTGEAPAAVKTRSAGPASVIARKTTPRNQRKAKGSRTSSPADLTSRIQSLEEQNEYIKWLVGGAILLAVML